MAEVSEILIPVDQLRPGLFIRLEGVGWFDQPFLFRSFKIRSMDQIAAVRSLGLEEVVYIPAKSDALPLKPGETFESDEDEPSAEMVLNELWHLKNERRERLGSMRDRINECEKRYTATVTQFNEIVKAILRGEESGLLAAVELSTGLAGQFLEDQESTLHLINAMGPEDTVYSHDLNVAVLSLIIGREVGLDKRRMNLLGLGALLHDIGTTRIEKKIMRKIGKLSGPEQGLFEMHPTFGKEIISAFDGFPAEARDIILQHHENVNGTGYPDGRKNEGISLLARIVAVADSYDLHCNKPDESESLTPYMALSYMYSHQKFRFDADILAKFIRCLGVYPPGTLVQLTNGSIGMVMAANPVNQLQPSVVLYDQEVPKKDALIVELSEETDLKVEKSVRTAHLPPEVRDYLNPRSRVSYYVG